MSPRCPEDGQAGWSARVEALQERMLLEEAMTEATADMSLQSIVDNSPMLQHQLRPKGINLVRGQLAHDQEEIAALESKGVSL